MTAPATRDQTLDLPGLDGANPLAFLAALGTLRTLARVWPEQNIKMSWRERDGAWRPVITGGLDMSHEAVVCAIQRLLCQQDSPSCHPHLTLGKNLSVSPAKFAEHARTAAEAAQPDNRRWSDFVVSFGCEHLRHPKLDRIDPSDLCFLFGSGHQHYLDTMAGLLRQVQPHHIEEALFGPWQYRDQRLSMRWDPADAREHAYQWKAPGDEATVTVWGANLLAAEGSAFYATLPTVRGESTVGFKRSARALEFTWPIWTSPINGDTTRTVVSMGELREDRIDSMLRNRGIALVYRSTRVRIGDGANFKWSFSPARAV